MTAADLVVAAMLLGVFVRGLWVLPRLWRNEWEWSWDRRDTSAAWGFGDALWHAFARVTPVSLVFAGALGGAFLLTRVAGESGVLPVLRDAFLLAVLLCFGIASTIVLFNRPKCAVAPHLRGQPGAVVSWGRRLRRK